MDCGFFDGGREARVKLVWRILIWTHSDVFSATMMSGVDKLDIASTLYTFHWRAVHTASVWRLGINDRLVNETESRLRQIRIAKPSSPVWLVTEPFVTKWNQRIPSIRRWQFMWNASNRRSSAFRRVHVSEPYNSTEMTRALYSRIFVCKLNPIRFQTLASLPKIFEARPMRLNISGVERSDEWISLPRYVKRSVDSTMWPCNSTGAGVTPWPKFCILLFD